jgi:hypothetical protein
LSTKKEGNSGGIDIMKFQILLQELEEEVAKAL